jgi:hypothetical protein
MIRYHRSILLHTGQRLVDAKPRERIGVSPKNEKLPDDFGFRSGATSVLTSRTMMLSELVAILERVPAKGNLPEFGRAVLEDNVLGKPTQTTRRTSRNRLTQLYSLDQRCVLYRAFRQLWEAEATGRPMLAYLVAVARDPLLRVMTPYVIERPTGSLFALEGVTGQLHIQWPGRFRSSTAVATAQRLASTWAQAGFLSGKLKKVRVRPVVTPTVATLALLQGYLSGRRGELLFDTCWVTTLDRQNDEIVALAEEASRQGWLSYRAAGAVTDVTFPRLLTPAEDRATYEPH